MKLNNRSKTITFPQYPPPPSRLVFPVFFCAPRDLLPNPQLPVDFRRVESSQKTRARKLTFKKIERSRKEGRTRAESCDDQHGFNENCDILSTDPGKKQT